MMIIDSLGEYVCRLGTKADIPEITQILIPLVVSKENTESLKEVEARRVTKNVRYFVNNYDSVVVEKNGEIIGAYVGTENDIVHIGNKYTDIHCMALLMHNVLNCVHNKFKESRFKILNDNYKKLFTVRVFGEDATAIDKFGDGKITLKGKENIEYLYSVLKDKHDKTGSTK